MPHRRDLQTPNNLGARFQSATCVARNASLQTGAPGTDNKLLAQILLTGFGVPSKLWFGEGRMRAIEKLKICVDRDECIGDGLCVDEAPETFEMDDDAKAIVLENSTDELENILDAAKACPLDIIIVEEKDSGKKLYPED